MDFQTSREVTQFNEKTSLQIGEVETNQDSPSPSCLSKFNSDTAACMTIGVPIMGLLVSAGTAIPCGGLGHSGFCNAAFVLQPLSLSLGVAAAGVFINNLYQSVSTNFSETVMEQDSPPPSCLNRFNSYSPVRKIACMATGVSASGLAAAAVSSLAYAATGNTDLSNAAFILQPLSLAFGFVGAVLLLYKIDTMVKEKQPQPHLQEI